MNYKPLIYIFVSATLFGISAPLSKMLVAGIPPVALAGFLYLGAFLGILIYSIAQRLVSTEMVVNTNLKARDYPWLIGAIISGGVVAPICLMYGLTYIAGFTTSLLLNLEGTFTAAIAVFLFRENAGRRLWLALFCMTVAGLFLTWDPSGGKFNLKGPLFVVFSMICWGIDNNLTRNISLRNPLQIARIKGLASGVVSICLAYAIGNRFEWDRTVLYAMLLGSLSYGISLVFFIKSLERLGSFRTGLFFSFAPFFGALVSLVLLREWIGWVMFPATILTACGVWLAGTEEHGHPHIHQEEVHTHVHAHNDLHHTHQHNATTEEPHIHEHRHSAQTHSHSHWPDTHHRHEH